jgi:exodeoxyribonuclease VII large subunit
VLWRGNAKKQRYRPVDGSSYAMHGYISFYPQTGKLQFYVDLIQPAGQGQLALQFELLKQRLQDEGLFAEERKRPLPERPKCIGVATSERGAAFQDILNVLRRRYPLAKVVLCSTLVQGDNAPSQLVGALEALNAHPEVEVIILARGGGSLEELWCFNDERVARAVFASKRPIITGVGHETDFTIVDFVADVRAPTPSAAAEMVTPDIAELVESVQALEDALYTLVRSDLDNSLSRLADLTRRIELSSPALKIPALQQRIEELESRISRELHHAFSHRRLELHSLEYRLKVLNPLQILERGYALVSRVKDNRAINDISLLNKGDNLKIRFANGEIQAEVK